MDTNQRTTLLACMLVTFVLGSIHSFSVFLVPLEQSLQLTRAQVSLIYSLALVFLTIAVLFGYRFYSRLRPTQMILVASAFAGIGLFVAALAMNWWALFIGYSILFGTANGLGYGYVLQLVGKSISQDKAFSMAAVTAAYAVGSVVFSRLLSTLVSQNGMVETLSILGIIVVTSGITSAVMMARSGAVYADSGLIERNTQSTTNRSIALWWLAYGCGVLAGLMAIGHAAGITQLLGSSYAESAWGAVLVGVGSAAGGFVVAVIVNRDNTNRYLVGLPLVSAASLLLLATTSSWALSVFFLSCVGFAYGALIAIYPFAVSEVFGEGDGPRVYGRIFTAWGFAGLVGPWLAGKLYDFHGSYTIALVSAAVVATGSSVFYLLIQKNEPAISA